MVCAGHGTVTYAADDGGIGDKYEGEWLNGDACMPFSDRIGSESILMSGVRVCVCVRKQARWKARVPISTAMVASIGASGETAW